MKWQRKNVSKTNIRSINESDHCLHLEPTLADICLKMSAMEIRQGSLSGVVGMLTEGLAIEWSQYE